jgi:hypothetical protein
MDLGLIEKYLKVKKYFAVRIKESARQTHKFTANTLFCRALSFLRKA